MYNIAVIGGDGTGPEVVAESLKVLNALDNGSKFKFTHLDYNGTRYLNKKVTLTDEELNGLKDYDAILLGAIGHPDVTPGILEREILLKLRFGLDQYINLRPIKLYENVATPLANKSHEDIDYVVVRENTGGLYTGIGSYTDQDTDAEQATQTMVYTAKQVRRCLKYAFEYTMNRHQHKPWKGLTDEEKEAGYIGKLTLCGKSNVLTYVFDLWNKELSNLSKKFPKIKCDYVHVDACCIYMVESPEIFDVIVTTNMFGDIITDLAAVTQGGMGIAPGANINPEGVSMFEPIGGTAPNFTGLNQINPLASIGSAALMCEYLGELEFAEKIQVAIQPNLFKNEINASW